MKSFWKNIIIPITTIASILFISIIFIYSDVEAAKKPEYTVTYLYGTKSYVETVEKGKNAIAPKDVIVPGYTFIGWSDSGKNIQSDKIILGMYTNNTMYKSATNASTTARKINDKITAPGKFWWDLSIKGVPYETCVIRWYNAINGDIYKTEVVKYGTTLPDPSEPRMEGYDFAGWEGSWYNITEDRNIAAYFTIIDKTGELTEQKTESPDKTVSENNVSFNGAVSSNNDSGPVDNTPKESDDNSSGSSLDTANNDKLDTLEDVPKEHGLLDILKGIFIK